MNNGTVTASLVYYSSFNDITTDIVFDSHVSNGISGGHSIVIIGWGVGYNINNNLVPYWLCRNSYGTNIQKDGHFKILRGSNFCRIESDVWTVTPFSVYNLLNAQNYISPNPDA